MGNVKNKKSVAGKSSNGSKLSKNEKSHEARTKRSGDKLSVAKKPEQTKEEFKYKQQAFDNKSYLTGGQHRWRLWKRLGKGGFGEVWKVYRKDRNEFYALKMESNPYYTQEYQDKYRLERVPDIVGKENIMKRLKVEVALLQQLVKENHPERKKHFVKFFDKGQTKDDFIKGLGIKFIVISLVGKSLSDIRKILLNKEFTMCTVFKFAIQAVEAISDLHSFGYIHRDLKPANFAAGIRDAYDDKIVYLLDFGLVKRVADKVVDGGEERMVLRARARGKTKVVLGTTTHMAIPAVTQQEQGYVDDLESLLYVVFDLLDRDFGMPWAEAVEKKNESLHVEIKERVMSGDFSDFENLWKKTKGHGRDYNGYVDVRIPHELKKTVALVKNTAYGEIPNYAAITESYKAVAKAYKLNLNDDFDWVGLFNRPKFNLKPPKENNAKK